MACTVYSPGFYAAIVSSAAQASFLRSAELGEVEKVRASLDRGNIDPNAQNGEALYRAVKNGHDEVVKALGGCVTEGLGRSLCCSIQNNSPPLFFLLLHKFPLREKDLRDSRALTKELRRPEMERTLEQELRGYSDSSHLNFPSQNFARLLL
ncbi:MAG: ankyrin repeat domain-containing protein, partial [Alphaproteobacteria bacterium]|nr:ankyrin repeat domain-containing protein [Alphaproteobacteria bacterium]